MLTPALQCKPRTKVLGVWTSRTELIVPLMALTPGTRGHGPWACMVRIWRLSLCVAHSAFHIACYTASHRGRGKTVVRESEDLCRRSRHACEMRRWKVPPRLVIRSRPIVK